MKMEIIDLRKENNEKHIIEGIDYDDIINKAKRKFGYFRVSKIID